MRRAAISLGFISLVDGLAAILERECTLLPGGAHPDCALQLTHAANVLRKPYSLDPKYNVLPMRTHFQDADTWLVVVLLFMITHSTYRNVCMLGSELELGICNLQAMAYKLNLLEYFIFMIDWGKQI